MARKYKEYKQLSLTAIHEEILKYWDEHHTFDESLEPYSLRFLRRSSIRKRTTGNPPRVGPID
jgi:hypothetical protein